MREDASKPTSHVYGPLVSGRKMVQLTIRTISHTEARAQALIKELRQTTQEVGEEQQREMRETVEREKKEKLQQGRRDAWRNGKFPRWNRKWKGRIGGGEGKIVEG